MKKIAIVGGGVIILAAATITPYFIGNTIEENFKKNITVIQNNIHDSDLTIETTDYKKGWFSSSAKTTIIVDGAPIVIDHKITHGPWCYFGLGKIQSTLEIPAENKPTIDKLFANKAPIEIISTLGFSGNTAITIFSPPITEQPLPDQPNSRISWGGMNGNININNDTINTDIKAAAFNYKRDDIDEDEDNLEISMQGLSMISNGAYIPDYAKAINKNWNSKATFTIEKLSIRTPTGLFNTGLNLSGALIDNKTTIDYTLALQFNNIQLPNSTYTPINKNGIVELTFNFNGVPKKPFADFVAKIQAIQGKKFELKDIENQLKDLAIAYIQGTPNADFNILVTGDDTQTSIISHAELATPDSASNLFSLASNLEKRLVITVSPRFSENLLNKLEENHLLQPNDKNQLIATITENNRFSSNNKEFSGKFEFKNGKFYSNGQPDPELMGVLEGILFMIKSNF